LLVGAGLASLLRTDNEPHREDNRSNKKEGDNNERRGQGLGNVIPFPSPDSASPVGCIGRRERLGGVLAFYERNAA
jgi:hypothetical protein